MRALTPILVVAFALVAGGCGASDEATQSRGDVVPASAAAYASIQSNLESDQWKQVDELLSRFPNGDGAVESLRREDREYDGALGPTVQLVWLDFANDGQDVVLLTQPQDEAKLRDLVRQSDEPAVFGDVHGWTAVAHTQAQLDRYRSALDGGALADDSRFQKATADLPDDALASVYVDGERATNALEDAFRARGAQLESSTGKVLAGSAALEAADEGFRLTGFVQTQGVPPEATDIGTLLGEVPAGAYFVANFNTPRETADRLRSQSLGPLEGEFGSALRALGTVVEGEGVLYVRPAPLIPEITLLLSPPDAAAAKAKLDALAATLPLVGGVSQGQVRIDDVQATKLSFGRYSVVYGAWDDRLAITTLPDGIRALREPGPKLVDEDRYKEAVDAAGVADDEHVVAYADLHQVVRLFEQLASNSTEPPLPLAAAGDLRPLRSFVASEKTNGDETTFRIFVEIR